MVIAEKEFKNNYKENYWSDVLTCLTSKQIIVKVRLYNSAECAFDYTPDNQDFDHYPKAQLSSVMVQIFQNLLWLQTPLVASC